MRTGSEFERFADCITLLRHSPHTAGEIAARLNAHPQAARRWCRTLTDKGHARETAKLVNGQAAKAWEWV